MVRPRLYRGGEVFPLNTCEVQVELRRIIARRSRGSFGVRRFTAAFVSLLFFFSEPKTRPEKQEKQKRRKSAALQKDPALSVGPAYLAESFQNGAGDGKRLQEGMNVVAEGGRE